MSFENAGPAEAKSGKSQTWIWILVGLGALGLCGCIGLIALLGLVGSQTAEVFNTIVRELEMTPAATFVPTGSTAVPEVSATAVNLSVDADALLQAPAYHATFDKQGGWYTGEIADPGDESLAGAVIEIKDGVLDVQAFSPETMFWVTPEVDYGSGVYEVEATVVEGAGKNGAGMLFHVDSTTDSFYVFEFTAEGYVWLGYCNGGCSEAQPFVAEGWVQSSAVNQGLGATNTLRVIADGPELTFILNGQVVGQTNDSQLASGDVGVFVENFSDGDSRVQFDNFKFNPIQP